MDLTDRKSHFEFGANWQDFSKSVNKARIDAAIAGLRKLFPDGIEGKTFLDIGCGSGIHSLAAVLMGAKSVTAIDIDENSVAATTRMLQEYAGKDAVWSASVQSIFDVPQDMLNKFEVVYSWGVLHHTGDMWHAIENAATLVVPGGLFALAIYAKTKMDRAWVIEKRIYSQAPKPIQWAMRQPYMAALLTGLALKGRNPLKIISQYSDGRGMKFSNDVHDWLGGYPYETASADELAKRVSAMGFDVVRSFPMDVSFGLVSSGCHEFVYKRRL